MKDSMEIPPHIALEMLARAGGEGPWGGNDIVDLERLPDYMVTQVMYGADPKLVVRSMPIGKKFPTYKPKKQRPPRSISKRDKEDKEWFYDTRRR